MKRYPFYPDQSQVDDLAEAHYKLQHIVDVASGKADSGGVPFQLQAEDPFPDLPIALSGTRGRSNARC